MNFLGDDSHWDEPDFMLSYIITALVNGTGMELGVTLMLRGLVISGTLVSEQTYLEKVTETLMNQVDLSKVDMPEQVKESLLALLDLRKMTEFNIDDYIMEDEVDDMEDEDWEEAEDDDEDWEDDDLDMPPPLQFLHLKDPLMLAGDPPIGFGEGSDVVLRLRLTSIDGWMLGRLTPDIPDFMDFGDNGVRH